MSGARCGTGPRVSLRSRGLLHRHHFIGLPFWSTLMRESRRVHSLIIWRHFCSSAVSGAAPAVELTYKDPAGQVANDDALSAAYAIAAAASQIWVTQTGSVGSVGVVALHSDQSGFDAKTGVAYDYVYAGARKIDFSPHAPLSTEARATPRANCR